jgi:streptogramin lyase
MKSPVAFRPQIDCLEDRCLLSSGFQEFPTPTLNSGPDEIILGPDGKFWFTEANAQQVGHITPAGVLPSSRINIRPGCTAPQMRRAWPRTCWPFSTETPPSKSWP